MSRVSRTALLLALAFSGPPAGVAIWSIGHTVWQTSDPCVRWDGGASRSLSATIRPGDTCVSITVVSESRLRAAIICALIPGGVLLAAALGIAGVAASRRRFILAGAFLMFAETLVVFTIAPLTLIAGVGFLFLARRAP